MAKRTLPLITALWSNYPAENHPCNGAWANQCAIRMSICLINSGFELTNYTEPVCSHGHARGAESLAVYLWQQVGRPVIAKTAEAGRQSVSGKSGIILFKDLTGFRGGTGDHIDIWNGNWTKTGDYFDSCRETWFWRV